MNSFLSGKESSFAEEYEILETIYIKSTLTDRQIQYMLVQDAAQQKYNVRKIDFQALDSADDCCFTVSNLLIRNC